MREFNRLLHAVRRAIITEVGGLDEHDVRITKDERVPPSCGAEFVCIYGLSITDEYPVIASSSYESMEFTIGLTRRLDAVPSGRVGQAIMSGNHEGYDMVAPHMYNRVSQIRNAIDGEWSLIGEVNGEGADDECDIMAPIKMIDLAPGIEEKDEDHWQMVPDPDRDRPMGYLLEMRFGGPYIVRKR